MRRMHHLPRIGRRRIPHERHVIPQLRGKPPGALDAGIGDQPGEHDMRHPPLPQPKIEIRIGEAALPPMLFDHDVARLGREIGMPLAAPFAPGEGVALHDEALGRIRMLPGLVIPRFPAPVRHDDGRQPRPAHRRQQGAEIVQQPDLLPDLLFPNRWLYY